MRAAPIWQQHIQGFAREQFDNGCSINEDPVPLAPDTNTLYAAVASAADTFDRAIASFTNPLWLPPGARARARGRVMIDGANALGNNSTIVRVNNNAGTPLNILDLYLNASKQINWFSNGGVLSAADRNDTSTFVLADNTEYWCEAEWFSGGGTGGTFGKTAVGGTLYTASIGDFEIQGPYTLPQDGFVPKLTARVGGLAGTSTCHMRLVMFRDNAGAPGDFYAITSPRTILTTDAVANLDFTFGAGGHLVQNGEKFWIGFWTDGHFTIAGDAATPGSTFDLGNPYSATLDPHDPWDPTTDPGGTGTHGTSGQLYTIFATYIASGLKRLWINTDPTLVGGENTPVILQTGLVGTPAGAVCGEWRKGIDHVDGTQTTPFAMRFSRWQISAGDPITDLVAPVNFVGPTLVGHAITGETMRCDPGVWGDNPSLTYQYESTPDLVTWTPIPNGAGQNYIEEDFLIGKQIRCAVTGTNALGTFTAHTAPSGVIVAGGPVPLTPPVIVGLPLVGVLLVSDNGTWGNGPTFYEYQWQESLFRDSGYSDISGALASSRLMQDPEQLHWIRIRVTARNLSGSGVAYSDPVGPVPAVPSATTRIAAYKGEVAWGQATGGLFTFGVSLLGGTDLLAASSWSAPFAGPNFDITKDLREANITRGRDSDLSTMRAGQIVLSLRDKDGIYNPENYASPLYNLIDTDIPVRFSATLAGVADPIPLFYGFISDIEADASGRGTSTITAVDFLDKLERQSPIIAAQPAASNDGQILGAILDWFRWTDPALRSLAPGDVINAAWSRADGSRTGLQLAAELLEAERGIVFADKQGAVTFLDRNSRYTAVSKGRIDREMTAFPVGRTNANVVNQWTVQRTDMAGNPVGTPQTASDAASDHKHGTIAQTLATPFLNSDSDALSLAQYLILRTANTLTLVYEVPINIPDAATMLQVLSRDLGDRVTLTIAPRNMAPFTSDFTIEAIVHNITTRGGPRHACIWRVSAVQTSLPFRFGLSTFGGTDTLSY